MTVSPLRSRCRNYTHPSRSFVPISRGKFICTYTYFIVANSSKTKYNNLRLKFVSELKCYMELRLRPFSSLFTQLSVGFNVMCRLHSITKLDAWQRLFYKWSYLYYFMELNMQCEVSVPTGVFSKPFIRIRTRGVSLDPEGVYVYCHVMSISFHRSLVNITPFRSLPKKKTFHFHLSEIRKNTIYKLMWWLYKARYNTMYFNNLVGYSSGDVTSGALQI